MFASLDAGAFSCITVPRSSYREIVSTQHSALEYGSDLHVNECQKIRHYRARSTEE